ncbi:homoserine kinase [Candidatus Scalindua japonica]|uniref:Homoserine kinase n=1 Tax=Candidatus Scalindua japonica TaxID=1284222 RepID=A0A286TTM8_9BACT|nr:hypothetical protein [Candidatus Scalindua japonica]GAX59237.1 homoserine kinase [Candidatus Scalindua japonica]
MENNQFRLSINAKTIIIILLLLNVGYAYKKIKQYDNIKEVGYIRERTDQEQIRKRIMKSFGSVQERDQLVNDFAKLKEATKNLSAALQEKNEKINRVHKELEETKLKYKKERAYLHKKIRGMADGFSKRKDRYELRNKANKELKESTSKFKTENAGLNKKIQDLENLLHKPDNQ